MRAYCRAQALAIYMYNMTDYCASDIQWSASGKQQSFSIISDDRERVVISVVGCRLQKTAARTPDFRVGKPWPVSFELRTLWRVRNYKVDCICAGCRSNGLWFLQFKKKPMDSTCSTSITDGTTAVYLSHYLHLAATQKDFFRDDWYNSAQKL